MDQKEILRVLPQREPMRMVDDILELELGKRAVGYRRVRDDEVWLKGHFPGYPVFPGVLLIEHMAQVSLFITGGTENGGNEPEKLPYLARVDTVKFLSPVYPGMELYTEARLLSSGAGFAKTEAVVYTDRERKKTAARGKLTCWLGTDVE